MSDRPPQYHGFRRAISIVLGCVFVAIGAVGAVLPVLPTTPFLLLAAFFFVRSSPRLYHWLLRSPFFGPFLKDWQRHRGVRMRVKVTAIAVVVAAVGASFIWGNLSAPVLTALLVLAGIGVAVVISLPGIREER